MADATMNAPEQKPAETTNQSDVEKNKTMAILAYFIFFLPLLTDAKNSEFAKFHANQSLILLIASIALSVVSSILMIFLIGLILWPLGGLFIFVLWVMGIMNASAGKMTRLPVLGKFDLIK